MKLATLRNGARDGALVVVASDMARYLPAKDVAPTLQAALDDWDSVVPRLEELNARLPGDPAAIPFNEMNALSPLPRAYQWADGSAYLNHVELVRKARGAEMPPSFLTSPLLYQGGSDCFLAPREPILQADECAGIDLEAEVAVVLDDVPMGVPADEAGAFIKLVMLVNDVSLRNVIPAELGKGFGFFQSKPSSAFSPVAATPDALGAAWDGGRLSLPLCVDVNDKPFGRANAGADMTFEFPDLIAHAAKTRPLAAGTIIGSGTVSNKLDGGPGKPIADGGVGYSCIAEIRMIETIENGKPSTQFLKFGDKVRIWMEDSSGNNIFGTIEQTVAEYSPSD